MSVVNVLRSLAVHRFLVVHDAVKWCVRTHKSVELAVELTKLFAGLWSKSCRSHEVLIALLRRALRKGCYKVCLDIEATCVGKCPRDLIIDLI